MFQRPGQWCRAKHHSTEPRVRMNDGVREAADPGMKLGRSGFDNQEIASGEVVFDRKQAYFTGGDDKVIYAGAPKGVP